MKPLPELTDLLHCPTPDSWIALALDNQPLLLIDHANCERKAASTALKLMARYTDRSVLLTKMSRLAREELRHFEQVTQLMKQRQIAYVKVSASRYAAALWELVRADEPNRLVDTLICGAFIEARSCERFASLAPCLDPTLQAFYRSLLKSESRHFQDYLQLAYSYAAEQDLAPVIDRFARRERDLIETPDREFRFHSGAGM